MDSAPRFRFLPLVGALLAAPLLAPGTPDCGALPVDCRQGVACDDGDPCTVDDVCDDAVCAGTPRRCDDGDRCNGVETCVAATGACAADDVPDCDDADATTLDACDPAAGCVHRPCHVPVILGYPPGVSADHSAIADYLADLGLTSVNRFLPYSGISADDLSGACLAIYDCGGWDWTRYKGGHAQELVDVLTAARDAGVPLYLLGDDIAQAQSAVSGATELTHLSDDGGGSSCRVTIVDDAHPVTNGPFGLVQGFDYPWDADLARHLRLEDQVLARSEDPKGDLVLTYRHASGAAVVVQATNLCGGGGEHDTCTATGALLEESERLFKNAVLYLLGDGQGASCDCDDGDRCNGLESCLAASGACVAGVPLDCDDEEPCTADTCESGGCRHAAIADCAPEDCADGRDNDRDGETDCADPDCADAPGCPPAGDCDTADVRRLECGQVLPFATLEAGFLEIVLPTETEVDIVNASNSADQHYNDLVLIEGDCAAGNVVAVAAYEDSVIRHTLQARVPYYVGINPWGPTPAEVHIALRCYGLERCADGVDDDEDHYADCLDADCTGDAACPATACQDQDRDGFGAGCAAPDCDDRARDCARDCVTDVDNDGQPDCADACLDADGDGRCDPCGDGLVAAGETCDDGNAAAGDGCDATCQVEASWACSHPSGCTWDGRSNGLALTAVGRYTVRFTADAVVRVRLWGAGGGGGGSSLLQDRGGGGGGGATSIEWDGELIAVAGGGGGGGAGDAGSLGAGGGAGGYGEVFLSVAAGDLLVVEVGGGGEAGCGERSGDGGDPEGGAGSTCSGGDSTFGGGGGRVAGCGGAGSSVYGGGGGGDGFSVFGGAGGGDSGTGCDGVSVWGGDAGCYSGAAGGDSGGGGGGGARAQYVEVGATGDPGEAGGHGAASPRGGAGGTPAAPAGVAPGGGGAGSGGCEGGAGGAGRALLEPIVP